MGKDFRKFKSIHTRTLVIIVVAIIVFFALNIGTMLISERRVLMDRAMQNSLKLSHSYAYNVGLMIDNSAQLIVGMVNDPSMKLMDEKAICRVLTRLMSLDSTLYDDAFYIRKGSVINVKGEEQQGEIRKYYSKMLESKAGYQIVNVATCNAFTSPTFAISAPVKDDLGHVIAAVAFAIDISEFSNRIKAYNLDDSSYAWVIDNYGTIIAHPNESYPLCMNIADPEILDRHNFYNISAMMMRERQGVGLYHDDSIDQTKIVTFAEIPNTPGWKLNITSLKADIYSHIPRVINQVLLITLVLSLILIIVSNWLAGTIMEPINELTKKVENSVDNNFETISIRSDYDEVNKLISSYNHVTDEIKTYTQGLEALVAERTQKLNQLNEQLNQQNRNLSETIVSLNEVSRRDVLTGLFNREMIYRYLEEVVNDIDIGLIEEATLLFLDLDNFKFYNDTFGHNLGDQILLRVTKVFKQVLRKGDFIARYGGDEFVIVLKSVSVDNAKRIKSKLKLAISEMISSFVEEAADDFIGHKEKASSLLGISIGLVQIKAEYLPSIDELLIEADAMMYCEKQKKR